LTSLTVAYEGSTSLLKKRSWPASCRAPARSWSSTAPRLARQIKAKLHHCGLITPSSRRLLSHRYVREIESWTLPPERRASLKMWAEQWRFVTRQLLEMRRLLREQAATPAELEKV
jgi:hypothetical protein